jgi:hypothetical protein
MLNNFVKEQENKTPLELQEIKERLNHSLTDADLRAYLGKDVNKHILKYSELANYPSITDLLPIDRSYKIILVESEFNSGHWICLMRYKDKYGVNTIEFFNSYGNKPTTELNSIKKCISYLLGQDENDLKRLLKQKEFKVIYNKKRLQKYKDTINTCGRHVVNRIVAMKNLMLDLEEYIDFMDTKKKQYDCDYDILVTIFIPSINP